MDLIALAVPFFILALLVEIALDRLKRTQYYRSNDAINSISTGILSTTTKYFTNILQWTILGFVLRNFAFIDMQLSWFDASFRGVLLWTTAAIGWDFCYYWNHRFGHEVSILWAAHSVHHQSEDYNLSTALRQTSTSFIFSWIFYVPLYVIGFPVEIVVTVGAANLLYQFWVHTQLVNRLGILDRILVTPSNHRVHHAQNERYIDKNYGGIFILWDRWFGTFVEEDNEIPVVFGVRKPLRSWNPVWANFQVYDYLLFDARKALSWRDKIGVWFRHTGWRPADVEAAHPKLRSDIASFQKFDPHLSAARRGYVLAQFVLVLLAAIGIGQAYALLGARAVFVPCILLWSQLYTLGLLNEDRAFAKRFELLRLLLLVPVGFYAMGVTLFPLTPAVLFAVASYVLVSALWLIKK